MSQEIHPQLEAWLENGPKNLENPDAILNDLRDLFARMTYGCLYLAEIGAPSLRGRDLVFPRSRSFGLESTEGDCGQLAYRVGKLMEEKHPRNPWVLSLAQGSEGQFFRDGGHRFILAQGEPTLVWDPTYKQVTPYTRSNYTLAHFTAFRYLAKEFPPKQNDELVPGASLPLHLTPDSRHLLELMNGHHGICLISRPSFTSGATPFDSEAMTSAVINRMSPNTRERLALLCENIRSACGQPVQTKNLADLLRRY